MLSLSRECREECGDGGLRIISLSTVLDPIQVRELLWTQGSKRVLTTELISSKTKEFVSRIQQLKNCEYVCLYKSGETFPVGGHASDIGEVA